MSSAFLLTLTAFSVIASALVSGVFLTFSDFVMRSLDRSKRPAGIEAMQIINREVFKTLFMVLLIGMSVVSLILIWAASTRETGAPTMLLTVGGASYVFGVFVVTLLGNVPMNERLDGLAHASGEAASYWAEVYFPRWTFWNHVRTFCAGFASVCFLLAAINLGSA